MHTADQIDALLPQTQCTRCGYPGCRPYAEAIAARRGRHQPLPAGRRRHHRRARARCSGGRCSRSIPQHGAEGPPLVAQIDEAALHRLRQVPAALPGRCHRRGAASRCTPSAGAVHGLRAVRRALPGRLHHHGAARARSRRRLAAPAPADNRARYAARNRRLARARRARAAALLQ